MSPAWNRHTLLLTVVTLAASLGTGVGVAQEEGRPAARDVPLRKVIRTQRLRVPADLFKEETVSFNRARVDQSGTIRADGHNLDLYGAVLIRRDRICASPEGARWTCGQRAFMATRALVEGGAAPQLQLQGGRRRAQSGLLGRRQRRDRVPPQSGLGRACPRCNRGKLCPSRGVGTTHQGLAFGETVRHSASWSHRIGTQRRMGIVFCAGRSRRR
jgi:hypothetical protein